MGLALGVGWLGYTLTYFGFCSLRGAGVGLLDLVIPGRTVVIPGGQTAGAQSPNQVPGASTNKESQAWIDANPCVLPHPDQGPNDFWNGVAIMKCKAAGGTMRSN